MGVYPEGSVFSDSIYNNAVASALADKQAGDQYAAEDKAVAEYEWGYAPSAAGNQYSRYAMMQRNQGIQATDQTNQAASMPGSVRSGAYKIRRNNLLFSQGQEADSLRAAYDAMGRDYQRSAEGRQRSYDNSRYGAYAEAMQRKLNEPLPEVPEAEQGPPLVAPGIGGVVGAPAPSQPRRKSRNTNTIAPAKTRSTFGWNKPSTRLTAGGSITPVRGGRRRR